MSSDPANPIFILKIFIGDSLIETINILQNCPEVQDWIANKYRSIYKGLYDTSIDDI